VCSRDSDLCSPRLCFSRPSIFLVGTFLCGFFSGSQLSPFLAMALCRFLGSTLFFLYAPSSLRIFFTTSCLTSPRLCTAISLYVYPFDNAGRRVEGIFIVLLTPWAPFIFQPHPLQTIIDPRWLRPPPTPHGPPFKHPPLASWWPMPLPISPFLIPLASAPCTLPSFRAGFLAINIPHC